MNIARSILSIVLFCLFVLGAIFNITSWVKRGRGERYPSIAPLLPGLAGCVSFVIFPFYPLAKFAWLPLILDVGCLPYFSGAFVYLIHDWWITNPLYKVKELHSHSSDFKLEVKLYRTGQVRLLKTNLASRPPVITEPFWRSISMAGKWVEENDKLILLTDELEITYQRVKSNLYIWISSKEPTIFDKIDLESP